MRHTQLHYPYVEMRVAGFMSGSGTNLVKLIEYSKQKEKETGKAPYNVAVIFTDNAESNAPRIGKEFDIPVLIRDKQAFYKARNARLTDMEVRKDFDAETHDAMLHYEIDVLAFAGYMSVATVPLITSFLAVNVHPADLSIVGKNGKRKYTGDNAVRDAIIAEEKHLRSTTHIVEEEVDAGGILMISNPVKVEHADEIYKKHYEAHTLGFSGMQERRDMADSLEKEVSALVASNQNRLKEAGDWKIFPKTLELIAQGKFARNKWDQTLYFEGNYISEGVNFEDLK